MSKYSTWEQSTFLLNLNFPKFPTVKNCKHAKVWAEDKLISVTLVLATSQRKVTGSPHLLLISPAGPSRPLSALFIPNEHTQCLHTNATHRCNRTLNYKTIYGICLWWKCHNFNKTDFANNLNSIWEIILR